MAYNRTTWSDREVEKPLTYTKVENADGTITLTPAEGTVFQAGTPIIAENMNKIEDQLIVTDTHINNKANPHGVTASQLDVYTKADVYTKGESDGKYQTKLAYRETTQMTSNENRTYPANTWNDIYFAGEKNRTSGINSNSGYGFIVKNGSWYNVTVAVSIGNLTTTSGWILARLDCGADQWRIDGRHFTSNGNLSLSGSVIDYIPTDAMVKLKIYCSAGFDVIGTAGEFRGYMLARELL